MRGGTIGWLLGLVACLVAGALLAPLVAALAWGEPWLPFALACALGFALGAGALWRWRGAERALEVRAAFVVVTASWLLASALGALPYALSPGVAVSAIDALFESVSGFTTTGASGFASVEGLPGSLLLWRGLTQWLGGMGAILIGIGVLPVLGVGGMQFYKADAPGPTKDKIIARVAESARRLWALYLALTALGALALWLGGMTRFDAIAHAMGAVSTGGFSARDGSLGFYDSGRIQVVATLLMLAGGASFAILHRALGRGLPWRGSLELRTYVALFALAAALIAFDLIVHGAYTDLARALAHATFQAASILSTTGFTVADYDAWPALSHAVLFSLFFVGGMAGSTAGGVKVIRVVIYVRHGLGQFFKLVHPHGVASMRLDARNVEDAVIESVASFMALWAFLVGVGTLLFCLWGADLASGLTTSLALLGNVGVGFGSVGPGHSWAEAATGAKLVACVWMLLGRLEVYTVLVIATAAFWRR